MHDNIGGLNLGVVIAVGIDRTIGFPQVKASFTVICIGVLGPGIVYLNAVRLLAPALGFLFLQKEETVYRLCLGPGTALQISVDILHRGIKIMGGAAAFIPPEALGPG